MLSGYSFYFFCTNKWEGCLFFSPLEGKLELPFSWLALIIIHYTQTLLLFPGERGPLGREGVGGFPGGTGPRGPNGQQGKRGFDGRQGLTGDQGLPGFKGNSLHISV